MSSIDDIVYDSLNIKGGVHQQVKHFNTEVRKHYRSEVVSGLASLLMYSQLDVLLDSIDGFTAEQSQLVKSLTDNLSAAETELKELQQELPIAVAGVSIAAAGAEVKTLARSEEKLKNKRFLASSRLNSQTSKLNNLKEFRSEIEKIKEPNAIISNLL